jgi:Circularly permutated YpsA SLOG family
MIISGGQTGADRAALDWAIGHHLPHGGWCPRGRLAEDGPIPLNYALQETASSQYPARTQKNIVESDGTVVFSMTDVVEGGTKLTMDLARRLRKPHLLISAETMRDPGAGLRRFVAEQGIKRLNVAGPRGSKEPRIGEFVKQVLEEAFFPPGNG